jgi:peptidoglycan/xylan/chitin deacetylase (PgdA/CDA1 family)
VGPSRSAAYAAATSILVYHRFSPAVSDTMTVRTTTLRSHLEYLRSHGYTVIPLRTLVSALQHPETMLPERSVVITVDDGHRSVFTELLPLARELEVPVTLFIYPSAISNAPYAMTWTQLEELHDTGLFDIQSHTYWHPNFQVERRRLAPAAYQRFVTQQLELPRTILRKRLGVDADLLAWPFGIHDEALEAAARSCGYVAGFTLDRRLVVRGDRPRLLALPRFLVTDGMRERAFATMLPAEAR